MSYFLTTTAHGTTGTKTITVGFQPVGFRITVCGLWDGSDDIAHRSIGFTNGTQQYCTATCEGMATTTLNNRIVSHWEPNGSGFSEVLAISLPTSPDQVLNATTIKYKVLTATADYNLLIEAWN